MWNIMQCPQIKLFALYNYLNMLTIVKSDNKVKIVVVVLQADLNNFLGK
jgi:hypothetical protein